MTDAMDLGLPDGVSGARVLHQEPVYFVIWTSQKRGRLLTRLGEVDAVRGSAPGVWDRSGAFCETRLAFTAHATKPARRPPRPRTTRLSSSAARRDRGLPALRVA